jgi:hypothetical protein
MLLFKANLIDELCQQSQQRLTSRAVVTPHLSVQRDGQSDEQQKTDSRQLRVDHSRHSCKHASKRLEEKK